MQVFPDEKWPLLRHSEELLACEKNFLSVVYNNIVSGVLWLVRSIQSVSKCLFQGLTGRVIVQFVLPHQYLGDLRAKPTNLQSNVSF